MGDSSKSAQLLGVDLATVRKLAATVKPYVRADGTRIWSLTQLERKLRPEAYGWRRGGYLAPGRLPGPSPDSGRRCLAHPKRWRDP
jgi:hypothetical protein